MFKLIQFSLAPRAIGIVGMCLAAALAAPAIAQNLFAPVVMVNDAAITEYEIQQRQRFLAVLNAGGTNREAVIEELIETRLRNEAVRDAGLQLSEEGLMEGMEQFAARANLSREEFVQALEQSGVSEETFRDFVAAGLGWRDLIRGRYAGRVQISEAEIDRALASQGSGAGSGIRVLVSEIIIPAPPQRAAQVNALAEQISQSTSPQQFSSFARRYSATASRGRGGRLPWQPLSQLPPALHPIILSLAPGEVSDPLPIPNAVALFQLIDIEETGAPTQEFAAIEYASYYLSGGRSEATLTQAARIAAQVDVCDDLYGVAQGQPEEVLERETKKPAEIPQDIAFELSKLDEGEISTTLTRNDGQTLVVLMLCGRTAAANEEVSREDIAASIRQRRLSGFADSLLAQMRADARIVRK